MNKAQIIKTFSRLIVVATVAALGYGLIQFERVNYITTEQSLVAIFGGGFWIQILAVGVVLTDIAALARIFTPETGLGKEPKIVKTLWSIWMVVSLLDVSLNWFFATLEMEKNQPDVPSVLIGFEWVLPVITAVVIYGVQFGLLYLFGQMADQLLHGKTNTSNPVAAQQRMSQPINNNSNNPRNGHGGGNGFKPPVPPDELRRLQQQHGLPPLRSPLEKPRLDE